MRRFLSYLFHGPAWLTFFVMTVSGFFSVSWLFLTFDLWREDGLSATSRPWPDSPSEYKGMLVSWLLGAVAFAGFVVCKGCLDGLLARVPERQTSASSPTGPKPR